MTTDPLDEDYPVDNIKYVWDEDYFGYANPYSPLALQEFRIGSNVRPPRERRIAGSKRVARYKNEQAIKLEGSLAPQLLQSITAHPSLSTQSFEELRVECYAQSIIAQGRPPASVDPVATPAAVIPPLFNAYRDKADDNKNLPNEIIMAD